MTKKYINKDKILEWLNSKQIDFKSCEGVGFVLECEWAQLIKFIKDGEFD